MSYKLPPHQCPNCGHKLDAATNAVGNTEPSEGDITICINCMVVLQFNEDFSYRFADKESVTFLEEECSQSIDWREGKPFISSLSR